AVLVRGVHELVGLVEPHRELAGLGQVAAPPAARLVGDVVPGVGVAAAGAADALDDDEPVGVGLENRVAGPLGGQAPVAVHGAAAPAGAGAVRVRTVRVRLVVQVRADDRGVAGVVPGQHLPVADPGRLGGGRDVPEGALAGGGRAVPVEQDAHALAAGVVDD